MGGKDEWWEFGCDCSEQLKWDWSWLDRIYCINLRSRPDRLLESQSEFHRVGLCKRILYYRPERPTDEEWQTYQCSLIARGKQDSVMTVTKGAYGCWRSHQAVMEHALRNGYNHILVFEDDVTFLSNLTPTIAKEVLPNLVSRLPVGADFLHLGYFPYAGHPVSSGHAFRLWRVKALCTVAYIVTFRGMQRICGADYTIPLDFWMLKNSQQYAVFPKIAWQRKSSTDVEEQWLGCPTTAIKQFGNVFYRSTQSIVDTFMLIILPLVLITIFLLLIAFAIRQLLISTKSHGRGEVDLDEMSSMKPREKTME